MPPACSVNFHCGAGARFSPLYTSVKTSSVPSTAGLAQECNRQLEAIRRTNADVARATLRQKEELTSLRDGAWVVEDVVVSLQCKARVVRSVEPFSTETLLFFLDLRRIRHTQRWRSR